MQIQSGRTVPLREAVTHLRILSQTGIFSRIFSVYHYEMSGCVHKPEETGLRSARARSVAKIH